MFKKFDKTKDVSSYSKYPIFETNPDLAEEILPKKAPMVVAKVGLALLQIVLHHDVPLFFNHDDGPFMPTLRLLHQLPEMLPSVRADKGAIPFVLSGANVMAPGLVSKGGSLEGNVIEAGMPVGILAEGKESHMAIGLLKMSTSDISEKGKGVAIEMGHFIGDDLWKLETF